MTFCMRDGETWVRVGANTVVGDLRLSHRWLAGLSAKERAALGAFEEVETPRPQGVKVLGDTVRDVGGAPTQAWITEPYTAEEVAAIRLEVVAAVKREAERRIGLVMPPPQQWNALQLAQTMITTHGPDPAAWPEGPDRTQYEADVGRWASVNALRAASNAIEAALPADAEGLAAFDASAADLWPVEA